MICQISHIVYQICFSILDNILSSHLILHYSTSYYIVLISYYVMSDCKTFFNIISCYILRYICTMCFVYIDMYILRPLVKRCFVLGNTGCWEIPVVWLAGKQETLSISAFLAAGRPNRAILKSHCER